MNTTVAATTSSSSSNNATAVETLKIIYIFINCAITYFALIPAYSKRCRNSSVSLSLMNALAGGLFLAMALVHILPEAVSDYTSSMSSQDSTTTTTTTTNQ